MLFSKVASLADGVFEDEFTLMKSQSTCLKGTRSLALSSLLYPGVSDGSFGRLMVLDSLKGNSDSSSAA